VIGSDLPDLPARVVRDAVSALNGAQRRVVLGPATDGGYYLIGLNGAHPLLFRDIHWSTDRVLAQTCAAAKADGLDVRLLDPWADVDSAADLERLASGASESGARRTRAFALEQMGRLAPDVSSLR
jgi:hypothetical protein